MFFLALYFLGENCEKNGCLYCLSTSVSFHLSNNSNQRKKKKGFDKSERSRSTGAETSFQFLFI